MFLKMLAYLAIAVICVTGATAENASTRATNYYMDTMLETYVRGEFVRNDWIPLKLSNFTSKFNSSVIGIRTTGVANYSNGTIDGFSNGHRQGDCSPPYWSGGNYTMKCTVVFPLIRVLYNVRVKYGSLPSTRVSAEGNVTRSQLAVVLTSFPNWNVPTVKNITIIGDGVLDYLFTGWGMFNSYLDPLAEDFTKHVARDISTIVYGLYWDTLSRMSRRQPLPRPI